MSDVGVAVAVTAKHTIINGKRSDTPDWAFARGFGEFLSMLCRVAGSRVFTVLLDRSAAELLGLPTGELPTGRAGRESAAAVAARAAGWEVREVHRWSRLRRGAGPGRVTVHVGLTEFVDFSYSPIIDPDDWEATTLALATWQGLTGLPWSGSGGDVTNDLLWHGHQDAKPRPVWRDTSGPDRLEAAELPYGRSVWRGPLVEAADGSRPSHVTVVDKRRAYLAGYSTAEVPMEALTFAERPEWNRKRAGWWRVLIAPGAWELGTLLPDPAGYGPVLADGSRWLTTPTVALLLQLAKDGFHPGIGEFVSGWTAPGTPILKDLAKTIRDTYDRAAAIEDPAVRDLVREAAKSLYRMPMGMWSSLNGQSQILRYDWTATVVAVSRANVWRKCWQIGRGADDRFAGPWPLLIETDGVAYPSGPDPVAPQGFDMSDRLGGWKVKEVKEIKMRETETAA
jgi:hypothetical protein